MAEVVFSGVSRVFPGSDRPAVDRLDLTVQDGEFLALVGPSGCGKSTTLRMLAGLEDVDGGTVRIGERDVTSEPPKSRDIAMVFQNYALYPHMSVRDNIAFHLKVRRTAKPEREERVQDAARLLDLVDLLARKPGQLSGGQRQRVAMGRAIVREPRAFLMDEPLSNLDAKLRVQTRSQIAELQQRLRVTTVYVTHDQVEAMTMGDRIAVLDRGVLQQVATPRELYEEPLNTFVAGFIGSPSMNLFTLPVVDGRASLGGWSVALEPGQLAQLGDAPGGPSVTVGVRAEGLELADPGAGLGASVRLVEELGSDGFVYADSPAGPLVVRVAGRSRLGRGDTVHVAPKADAVHLFDTASGRRLR